MKTATKIAAMLFVLGFFDVGILLRNRLSGIVPVARAASIYSATTAAAQEDEDRSASECSLKTVKGSYGISTTGWIVSAGPIGPVADVGIITFDGDGGVSQTTTVSLNGMIIPKRTSLSGSYEVNSEECIGSINLTLPGPTGPITSTSNMVIVNHGKELRTIVTGTGRVLAGTAERQ
jgi:hypothetical protein